MAQTQQLISKDMTIAEILTAFPEKTLDMSEIMREFGIHCVGCGAAAFETLEQGVLGHGFGEEDLQKLIHNLNTLLNDSPIEPNTNIHKKQINTDKPTLSFTLTSSAITKLKQLIKEQKEKPLKNVLRVSVLSGGCSGLTYNLELLDSAPKSDIIKRQENQLISIAKDSTEHLDGSTLDFVDTLNESGFKFSNPNEEASCGCGKSFH
jgi:iron-sulfur cluster assembly protein